MFVPKRRSMRTKEATTKCRLMSPATQLPGVPVTQLDSDGCDALEQLLDGLYVARDGAPVTSASQRADVITVSTSAER